MAKKITGKVTSTMANKTVVITVTSRPTHPLYGKQYTRSRKYKAHDEDNQAKVGDTIEIVECRPISKHKSFRLERVLQTGHAAVELKDESLELIQKKSPQAAPEKKEKA